MYTILLGVTRKRAKKAPMELPPYLTGYMTARLLNVTRATIGRRVAAGKYPGAYKLSGRIFVPSSLFPEEEVRALLKKERDQSPD